MQELWSQGRENERWPGTNINMVKIHTHVWHREVRLPTFLFGGKKKKRNQPMCGSAGGSRR